MYIFITKKGTFNCTQIKTRMKQNIKNILNMENNPYCWKQINKDNDYQVICFKGM